MTCKYSLVDTWLHAIARLHLVLYEIFETYQGILTTLLCIHKPCSLVHCCWVVDCLVVLLIVIVVVVMVVVVLVLFVLLCYKTYFRFFWFSDVLK